MHFSQRALIYNRADFEFGDRQLRIMIDDGRLKVGFWVPYTEISAKRSVKSFPEKAIPRLGFSLIAGAVAAFILTQAHPVGISCAICAVSFLLGAALVAGRKYAQFDATHIPLESGNTILVFHDSQHHVILNEIYRYRKAEMMRVYGKIDPLNHPQLELKKFSWLRDENIISDHELAEARFKIEALAKMYSRH